MANENDIKKQNEERYCPPGMMADNLEEKLEQWMGQTVTVYLYDTEVTGILQGIGDDYLALLVQNNLSREVLIPLYAVMMMVTGEPLATAGTAQQAVNNNIL